jgi:hypothetical protein
MDLDSLLKSNNIILLAGIHLTNIMSIDEQFAKCLNDIIDDGINDLVVFDKIPTVYNSKTWPMTTNLKCWYCDCSFSGVPIFVPLYISPHFEYDGTLNIIVDLDRGGNFCSSNCAYTCIVKEYPIQLRQSRQFMLKILLKNLWPERDISFIEVRPKTSRIEYGGNMTLDDYKKRFFTRD